MPIRRQSLPKAFAAFPNETHMGVSIVLPLWPRTLLLVQYKNGWRHTNFLQHSQKLLLGTLFWTCSPKVRNITMAVFSSIRTKEVRVSQSVVGRNNAQKSHGIVGMVKNPYVFMTCAFASLGCMMYGYDQV